MVDQKAAPEGARKQSLTPEQRARYTARAVKRYQNDAEHRAAVREQQRQRYANDPAFREAAKRRAAERRRDKPDQCKRKDREWRAENRDAIRVMQQAWVAANPDRNRATAKRGQHARRARKRDASGSFTEAEWQETLLLYGHACAYCLRTTRKLTIEHMLSLARGGANTSENIVPACGPCNSRKGTRTPLEFISSIRLA